MDEGGYEYGNHICFGNRSEVELLRQAEEALAAAEVPVGCVFVRDGRIIARARNRTNELRNVYTLAPDLNPLC